MQGVFNHELIHVHGRVALTRTIVAVTVRSPLRPYLPPTAEVAPPPSGQPQPLPLNPSNLTGTALTSKP
jgi:hypothetical protein